MRHTYLLILVLLGLVAGAFSSCISDAVSTSASDRLSFSRDTVDFDTVFTGEGTPTARLLVFNRAKKGVNISEIRLAGGDASRFSINVDGRSGRVFHDVEIRGRDSIFVFIECLLPETSSAEPYLESDRLVFVTNGVRQEVELEAYGQNVTRLRGVKVTEELTLGPERPYVVYDSLAVEAGGLLRIEAGARVLFHDGARLSVRGRVEAAGEPGRLVQLRGDRLDDVLPDVGYDILAGQWEGVRIWPESFGNRLEYVDMRSTVSGLRVDSCGDLSRSKLLLRNSWLHNSQGSVLESRHAKVDAFGVCFSESARAVVSLTGGEHRFVQCTIANNYLFSAITEPLLCLYHCLPEEKDDPLPATVPLMKMSLENSIIYGLAGDLNQSDLSGSEVWLRYVSLKSGGSDDDNFQHCLWDTDPLFLTRRSDYYFNYRVEEGSPVIGAGDAAYVGAETAVDIDGQDRLSGGAPTLGAYAR